MSNPSDIISLDHFQQDEIYAWLDTASLIMQGNIKPKDDFEGKILCPIFMQESLNAYMHATSSFGRLGGTVLSLKTNKRFGSSWAEPIQDYGTLVNASCDYVIFRSATRNDLYEFRDWCDLPLINAGSGTGTGSEHPMQALVDLFTIRKEFGKKTLNILMVGGEHNPTTRSQIKLFLKFGYEITILSPESPVPNEDIEELYKRKCQRAYDIRDVELGPYDVIYHNGIDENLIEGSISEYQITRYLLEKGGFRGKVMHSLPRKNELSRNVDETVHNLYFSQMEMSKYVYQSIFLHQKFGLFSRIANGGAYSSAPIEEKLH